MSPEDGKSMLVVQGTRKETTEVFKSESVPMLLLLATFGQVRLMQ